jgi:antitoxin ParD1/3/4
MQLQLSPELAQFVDDQVAAGVYMSPHEVIRDALRLLRHHEQERAVLIADLRQKVDIGIAQLDRGESIPADEVFRKLRERSTGNRSEP